MKPHQAVGSTVLLLEAISSKPTLLTSEELATMCRVVERSGCLLLNEIRRRRADNSNREAAGKDLVVS